MPAAVRLLHVLAPSRLLLLQRRAASLHRGLRLLLRAPLPSVRCMLLGRDEAAQATNCRDVRAHPPARCGLQLSLCCKAISALEGSAACK
jgi:hypothetical protein